MKGYIIKIIGAALLSVFADIMSPKGWEKYIGVVTGMILLSVMVFPVAELKEIDLLKDIEGVDYSVETGLKQYQSALMSEFSKSIAIDVRDRIKREFDCDVSAEATVDIDDNGNIKSISKIIIKGNDLNTDIKERISYIYDVDEVVIYDE